MNQNNPDKDDVTFQLTVSRLALSSRQPTQDIRVVVRINDVSKITCSGKRSWSKMTCSGKRPWPHSKVTWSHPFLFTAPPTATVAITICTLPGEFTNEWNKQLLGNQMITDVASLLESGDTWKCDVPGLSVGSATLSMTCKPSDVLSASDGHDCVSALRKYHSQLYALRKQFRNEPSMSTQVELGHARLDLCPLGHPSHTGTLNDLAHSFELLYDQKGNISDLNRAIEIFETRLVLCPLGHSEHASALRGLATSLRKHFRIQKNKVDLEKILDMEERHLKLCEVDQPDYEKALGRLASALKERYYIQGNQGDMIDLDRAIEMEEERLDLCQSGHPHHGEALGNLAISLGARYRRQGNLDDLDRSILLEEEKLELRPPDHRSHGLALQNLASVLKDRYKKRGDPSDLIRAIKLSKKALDSYPAQHSNFAFITSELAATILLPFKPSKKYLPSPPSQLELLPPPDEAFAIYRKLKDCAPAVSVDLWEATRAWVKNAEKRMHDHPSVLEAYQTSLSTLDHFTSFSSSLDSRHGIMQERVADLANDAFSCAIRKGEFQMAVELLEQGRGILWSQLARCDIPVTALQNRGDEGRELGEKYVQLSADLRRHAEGSGDKGMDVYWRVLREWQSVVDKIRCVDGYSRFLLPPRFEDLQQAAEDGPIIIVNASEYACDALIVLRTGPPVHVDLPSCSLDDVHQICSELSYLTQNPYAYDHHRESYVKKVLRDLWSSVVEPIANALQNTIRLPLGSRIWWCPTSKFTILPFHAAGPHRKGQKNLMDLYVSSYAPSLSALVRVRDRVRSQRKARDASRAARVVSFAAVGQDQPSEDTKLGPLPEVKREIENIRNETRMCKDVKFDTIEGVAATIDGAVEAFRDHRWIHLACHGAQHAEKPFESWFAMGDGKLTLMRIIQERYTNSEFAFLSACHTAVGDKSTPDEVLHLAAGMQFAGFNGVIGTLWRVDDAVAHQVVTRFYKEMFKHPDIDFQHAAEALNVAVVESAKEVSLEKRIVFVHIGL